MLQTLDHKTTKNFEDNRRKILQRIIFTIQLYVGHAAGGAVVEALRYKPEGRGIDSRWLHWNFSLT
jgi:hypothetical protein